MLLPPGVFSSSNPLQNPNQKKTIRKHYSKIIQCSNAINSYIEPKIEIFKCAAYASSNSLRLSNWIVQLTDTLRSGCEGD